MKKNKNIKTNTKLISKTKKVLPKFQMGGNLDLYGSATGGDTRTDALEKKKIENMNVSAGTKMKWFAAGQLAPALEWVGMDGVGDKWQEKAASEGGGAAFSVGSGFGEIGSAVGKYFTGDYQGMAGDATEAFGDFTNTAGYRKQKQGDWTKSENILKAGNSLNEIGGAISSSSSMGYNNMGGGMSGGMSGMQNQTKKNNNSFNTDGVGDLPDKNDFGLGDGGMGFAAMGGKIQELQGPSHENGGVPLDTDGDGEANIEAEGGETTDGDFIFSDRLKHKSGKTFAEVSKKIESKYKNKFNSLSDKTKDFELDMLKGENKKVKDLMEATINKDNTGLPKFGNGDYIYSSMMYPNSKNTNQNLQYPTPSTKTLPEMEDPVINLGSNDEIFNPYKNLQEPFNPNMGAEVRPNESEISIPKNNKAKTYITDGDKLQLAGSATGPLANAALLTYDALQKPEKVNRKYDTSPITKMRMSPEEGLKDIRQQFAITRNALKGNAKNFNVIANNMQGAMSKTQDAIGTYRNQVDTANKTLDIQHEGRVQQQNVNNINLYNQYELADAQNKAVKKNAVRQDITALTDTTSQGLKNAGEVLNSSASNEQKLKILKEAFPDFDINASNMKEYMKLYGEMFSFKGGTK